MGEITVGLIRGDIENLCIQGIDSIHVFDELPSTNDWLLDYIGKKPFTITLCVADKQTQGRGRSGRSWISPANSNIYMSLSYFPDIELRNLPSLSLVVGLAVVRVVMALGLEAKIKWPNDILIEGKKLAGVLIETKMIEKKLGVVIGLGVNVAMQDELVSESGLLSTDLRRNGIGGEGLDRNKLIASLVGEIKSCIELFAGEGFAGFRQEWLECDAYLGKRIEIHDAGKVVVSGIEAGVNELGMLLVEESGKLKQIYSGDVSLRVAL